MTRSFTRTADDCNKTRRLVTAACICTGLFLLADVVWLARSPLRFAPGNWTLIAVLILAGILEGGLVSMRADRTDGRLCGVINRCALLCRGATLLVLIGATFLVFSYLVTAAALPLQDDLLARIDRGLGFDWPGLLAAANRDPQFALVLTISYYSTVPLLIAIVLWLAMTEQRTRLAELLAALSFTFAGLAVGMITVPTAGAFAHYAPAASNFDNFIGAPDMWPFYATFAALRDGSLTVIEFTSATGIVGFPSFHASLAVVTAYAVRDDRWLCPAVLALNGIMLVATLPVGGHHLSELIGGLLTGLMAIALAGSCREGSRLSLRVPDYASAVKSRRMSA